VQDCEGDRHGRAALYEDDAGPRLLIMGGNRSIAAALGITTRAFLRTGEQGGVRSGS
jgi:hypothetical protein